MTVTTTYTNDTDNRLLLSKAMSELQVAAVGLERLRDLLNIDRDTRVVQAKFNDLSLRIENTLDLVAAVSRNLK